MGEVQAAVCMWVMCQDGVYGRALQGGYVEGGRGGMCER